MPDREELERLIAAAIAAARADTDVAPVVIVEEVLGDIDDELAAPAAPMAVQLANDRLNEASKILQEQGEIESAPVVAALIGIGHSLLAIREDAEVFFAGSGQ